MFLTAHLLRIRFSTEVGFQTLLLDPFATDVGKGNEVSSVAAETLLRFTFQLFLCQTNGIG